MHTETHQYESDKIPVWILPTSYIVVAILLGLCVFVLHIIPYEKSRSESILIYSYTNGVGAYGCKYGEILITNTDKLAVEDIVNIKIHSKDEDHFYYNAHIEDIYYDFERVSFVCLVNFSAEGIVCSTTEAAELPVQGEAEIIIGTSNLLDYVLGVAREMIFK